MKVGFSARYVIEAVEQLTGIRIARSTLSGWAKTGLVVPSVRWTGKRGLAHRVAYSRRDLEIVALIVEMRGEGLSPSKVRNLVATLNGLGVHAAEFWVDRATGFPVFDPPEDDDDFLPVGMRVEVPNARGARPDLTA